MAAPRPLPDSKGLVPGEPGSYLYKLNNGTLSAAEIAAQADIQ